MAKSAKTKPVEPKVSICDIDKKLADVWMARNGKNFRPFRQRQADALGHDIVERGWIITGDAIILDPGRFLINGQHRVWNISALDLHVRALVMTTEGMSKAQIAGLVQASDSGWKRSFGDWLRWLDYKNVTALAGTVALFIRLSDIRAMRVLGANRRILLRQSIQCLDENPSIVESVGATIVCNNIVSGSHIAALHYIVGKEDRDKADEFAKLVASGEGLSHDHPVRRLRERMIKNKTSIQKLGTRDRLRLLIRAWNYWICNRDCKNLVVRSTARINALRNATGATPKPGQEFPAIIMPSQAVASDGDLDLEYAE